MTRFQLQLRFVELAMVLVVGVMAGNAFLLLGESHDSRIALISICIAIAGIGYLDDGTMVVINGYRGLIGRQTPMTVGRLYKLAPARPYLLHRNMQSMPEPTGRTAAIIVAAGRGTRFGAPDKVLANLAGRPVLAYTLDAVETATDVDEVIVVAGAHTRDQIEQLVATSGWRKTRHVVIGGERRQDSVRAGFAAVQSMVEVVLIHDGARPFASPALFNACAAEARRSGAAIAAIPVTDTLKRASGGAILETVPRTDMWAAQTPQAFRTQLLHDAFDFAQANQLEVTDEAGILEAMKIPIAIVDGTPRNMKITTADDLDLATALIAGSLWDGQQ